MQAEESSLQLYGLDVDLKSKSDVEKERGFRDTERTCTERTLARIHMETRIGDDDD